MLPENGLNIGWGRHTEASGCELRERREREEERRRLRSWVPRRSSRCSSTGPIPSFMAPRRRRREPGDVSFGLSFFP